MPQERPLLAFLGDEGRVSLVSLASRQLAGTLRMAGSARAAAFSPDGQRLLTHGAPAPVFLPFFLPFSLLLPIIYPSVHVSLSLHSVSLLLVSLSVSL